MSALIFCQRLQREAEQMPKAPYPGPLGQKIWTQVSAQGWQQWLAHQTMLINENRLSPLDPKAKVYLQEQMQKFLFDHSADQPLGYVPPAES